MHGEQNIKISYLVYLKTVRTDGNVCDFESICESSYAIPIAPVPVPQCCEERMSKAGLKAI